MICPNYDTCPSCVKTIAWFGRPIGMTCPKCGTRLRFVVVPASGHVTAYRTLAKGAA